MSLKIRHWVLLTLLALAVVLAASFVTAEAWLDSLWGQQTLERKLSERFAVPVRLQGEFDTTLLPFVGASGKGLEFGESDNGGLLATSGRYQVALEIIPLFGKRLQIESLEIEDFHMFLPMGADAEPQATCRSRLGKSSAASGTRGVRRLCNAVERSRLPPKAGAGKGDSLNVQVKKLKYRAFAGNGEKRSTLDFPKLGWTFEYLPGGFEFDGIVLESAGQSARGQGCLLLTDRVALNLDLRADRFDLDAARKVFADDSGDENVLPVDLNLRFSASELTAAGAVARGAMIQLGDEPDCSGLTLYNGGLEIE